MISKQYIVMDKINIGEKVHYDRSAGNIAKKEINETLIR